MPKSIQMEEQENLLDNFWAMLQECETKAEADNDPVLKHQVEQYYQQYNRVRLQTLRGSEQLKPRWIIK